MKDLVIYKVLSQADPKFRDAPGRLILGGREIAVGRLIVGGREIPRFKSTSEAARYLSEMWADAGFHMKPEVIRARYNALKKADPDPDVVPEYVKKRL